MPLSTKCDEIHTSEVVDLKVTTCKHPPLDEISSLGDLRDHQAAPQLSLSHTPHTREFVGLILKAAGQP